VQNFLQVNSLPVGQQQHQNTEELHYSLPNSAQISKIGKTNRFPAELNDLALKMLALSVILPQNWHLSTYLLSRVNQHSGTWGFVVRKTISNTYQYTDYSKQTVSE